MNLGEVISALELQQADVNTITLSFDERLQRGIDRNTIQELSTCQFIRSNTDVILQGFTGSGKTYLACALGKQSSFKSVLLAFTD